MISFVIRSFSIVFVALGMVAAATPALAQETSPQLSVRADHHHPTNVIEQTGATGPLTVSTGPTNSRSGSAQGSASANYGYLRVNATAVTTEALTATDTLFAGQGVAKFTDTVTINAPGRAGTRGRVTFTARFSGRISAVGAHESHLGFHRSRAAIRYTARVGECCDTGTLALDYSVEGDGGSTSYNFLANEPAPLFTGEFTYGVPFQISLEIIGAAFTYWAGLQTANVEMLGSWQGATAVRDISSGEEVTNYTITSVTGANYAQPISTLETPQTHNADLAVTATGTPGSVADLGEVTYRVNVRNQGPQNANGVQALISCDNVVFVSTTLPAGSFTRLGSALNVSLPDLASGAETSFDIVYKAQQPHLPETKQRIAFGVRASSNALDGNLENNRAALEAPFSTAATVMPQYYFDRAITPPADYVANGGHFQAKAMNAQSYVVFDFDANHNDAAARRTPLVYTGSGKPFLALTWPGNLTPPAGEQPFITAISDVAQDGSFWVCGFYSPGQGSLPVAWRVRADGTSTLFALGLLEDASQGSASAINSSGEAIGFSRSDTRGFLTTKWLLPDTAARPVNTEAVLISDDQDIQEDGLAVGHGFTGDRSFTGAFVFDVRGTRGFTALPTISRRSIIAYAMANNRVVGGYDFMDSTGPGGPFVWALGDPALTRLPAPVGLLGDVSNLGGGQAGKYINAAGDIVGVANNPPSLSDFTNPSFQVFWKRQVDGSHRVYTLESILRQSNRGGSEYRFAELLGIANDGTILLKNTISGHSTFNLLRPGARPTNQPLNISTRLRVQPGDNALIGGMIVTGPESKTVVLRAIGPSLTEAGVPGALQDPVLQFYANGQLVDENDDWETYAAFFEPGQPAAGFKPKHPRESVIITTLEAGQAYTAVVRGKENGTGVGLVEAYDLSLNTDAQLANISTRGLVQVNDNVMIAGFILGGNGAKVLVRALGPKLAEDGVPGALQDPTLELVNANGQPIAFNDNWEEGQPNELPPGFAPKPAESAIVTSLGAGAYTAIVRGKNNTTGVGLVEVYTLQ